MSQNTLVINLTRFGDLLQTQPLLSALHKQGHTLGLVCLENFASTTSLLNHVNQVFSLRGAELLSLLDKQWENSLFELWQWRNTLLSFEPDCIINLTPSLSARLITRLFPECEYRGFYLDPDGFGKYSTPWAAFLQASSTQRGSSPFNLVDIMSKAGHLEAGDNDLQLPQDSLLKSAHQNLLAQCEHPVHGFVGFQLGASSEQRQWPVKSFVSLAAVLWEKHQLLPILFGSKGEQHLAEEYASTASTPFISRIGQTSLQELSALLKLTELLVTNDTGTMHLAAGLSVPVLALFMATAQPCDTGPYLEGCLCLEPEIDCHPCGFDTSCPSDYVCRQSIPSDVVASCVESFVKTKTWPERTAPSVRAWCTKKQPNGYMDLVSLSEQKTHDRAKWIAIQKPFYSQFLDQVHPITAPAEHHALSPEIHAEIVTALTQAKNALTLLLQQGLALSKMPRVMEKKFMTTWRMVCTILEDSPYFLVLSKMWLYQTQDQTHDLKGVFSTIEHYLHLVQVWSDYLSEQS